MVLNNINKNDSILLEVLASVFTVSSNFTDNPRSTYFVLVITMDNAAYKKAVWRVQNIKKRKSNETIILKRLRVVKKKLIPPSTQKI